MMTVFEKIKRAMSGTDPYENLQAEDGLTAILRCFSLCSVISVFCKAVQGRFIRVPDYSCSWIFERPR